MTLNAVFQRKLDREQAARREAESLLDIKSYELYETNKGLQQARHKLEERVENRTQALTRVVNELQKEIGRRESIEQELRSARDSALELADLKSDFLARVSHEIRTPLNAVIGMTGMVLESDLTTQQQQRLETVQSSGHLLLRLINDILDLSKIDAKKLELDYSAAEIRLLTKQAVSLVWLDATTKGIVFEIEHEAGEHARIVIDSGRLQQVLLNLLSNAIKYSDGGTVRILTRIEDCPDETKAPDALLSATGNSSSPLKYLRVTVQDEGRGIHPDNLETLFEPFTQFERPMHGSSGLGLTICQRICELMGGNIRAESTPGEGSTFEFTVVCSLADEAAESPRATKVTPKLSAVTAATHAAPNGKSTVAKLAGAEQLAQRKPLSILLADDYQVNRMVQLAQLEHLGYVADTVTNGEEVIRALAERDYDVILMDIRMPVMDGIEATRRIRRDVGLKQPYIVALTASALAGDPERFASAGIDGYLPKPVEIDDLAEALSIAYDDRGQSSSSTTNGTDGPPVEIDLNGLRSRLGSAVDELLRRVIPVFIRELPVRKEKLQKAYDAADPSSFAQLCHGLKGSSRSIGGTELAAACEKLEQQGFDGRLPSPETLTDLLNLADRTANALSELLDSPGN